jgi:hypothetical protein
MCYAANAMSHRIYPAVTLAALLLLACCSKPTQAPPPTAPAPPPPPPPAKAARPVVHAAWTFRTGPDCIALATAGRVRLTVAVRRSGPVRLTVVMPAEATRRPIAQFRGPAGAWSIHGIVSGREAVFSMRRDMDALSRVLMLLSGGMLALEPSDGDLPILDLPPSGGEGQQWFDCARNSVI